MHVTYNGTFICTYLSTTFIYVDSWKTRISRENFKVGPCTICILYYYTYRYTLGKNICIHIIGRYMITKKYNYCSKYPPLPTTKTIVWLFFFLKNSNV